MRKLQLVTKAEDAVNQALQDLSKEKLLVGMVGGTSVKSTYEELARQLGTQTQVDIFLADDRHVPVNDERRNAKQIKEQFVRQRPQNTTLHEHNADAKLKESIIKYTEELDKKNEKFDLLILSAGEDGHIASLFPNHQALGEEGRYTYVQDSPKPPKERITITTHEIEVAKAIILVFCGSKKETAFKQFMDSESTSEQIPAKYCIRGEGSLIVLRN